MDVNISRVFDDLVKILFDFSCKEDKLLEVGPSSTTNYSMVVTIHVESVTR